MIFEVILVLVRRIRVLVLSYLVFRVGIIIVIFLCYLMRAIDIAVSGGIVRCSDMCICVAIWTLRKGKNNLVILTTNKMGKLFSLMAIGTFWNVVSKKETMNLTIWKYGGQYLVKYYIAAADNLLCIKKCRTQWSVVSYLKKMNKRLKRFKKNLGCSNFT